MQPGCSRITPTTMRAEQHTTSIGHGWHRLPRPASASAYKESVWKQGAGRATRPISNAFTACTGGFNCWHAGCSRITPTTTRAEQPSSSIGRAWQHLPRACAPPCTASCYERRWKHAWNAPRARRVCRVHGRLQLLAGWLHITPTITHAEQPSSSIGRARQHLPRARTTMHGLRL